jgi:putative NADPH-quinone reductase
MKEPKTLVVFGSARRNGHTRALLDAFLAGATGDVHIVDAYRTKEISPCLDCRFCWKQRACAIKDGMQDIYRRIDGADCIVLAAPLYFHSVPGPMKSILDRFQMYWAGEVRGDKPAGPSRKGAILMVGGAPAFPDQFTAGEIVLKGVLGDLAAECAGMVTSDHSDVDAVAGNAAKQAEARDLARRIYADLH